MSKSVQPSPTVHGACLLGALFLLAGCPTNEDGFLLTLTKIDVPDCEGQKAGRRPTLQTGKFTLRITFLRRKPDKVTTGNIRQSYDPICWRVVKPGGRSDFLIRTPEGEVTEGPFTVMVEAFHAGKLAYVGRREQMQITHDKQGTIFMRPTIEATDVYTTKDIELDSRGKSGALSSLGFSCLDSPRYPRAFHSATLLPNGEVLVYGGIAGASGEVLASNQAFAVGTAEVYHPNYGDTTGHDSSFSVAGTDLPRRAFHHAFLLPSPAAGPYKVLVLGGLQPEVKEGKTQPVAHVAPSFMFTPYPGATAAPALMLTYTPGADGTVVSQELPTLPRALFPATTVRGDLLVFAGGAQKWTASEGFLGARALQLIKLEDPPVPKGQPPTLNNVRVGHAVAVLGDEGHVVIGGHMDGNETDHGEYLPAGSNNLLPFSAPAVAGPLATINHTLTAMGTTDAELAAGSNPPQEALWAGGFLLGPPASPTLRETGPNPQPQDQDYTLHMVRLGAPPMTRVVTSSNAGAVLPGHFRTVGHHDAVRLHDGSALLTGGKLGDELTHCGVETPFCASDQVVLYDYNMGTPIPRIPPEQNMAWKLFVPRLGHRMTRLLDNTVLITGGIALKKGTSEGRVLATPELFNPRTGHESEDLLQRSAATDSDQAGPTEICGARDGDGEEG